MPGGVGIHELLALGPILIKVLQTWGNEFESSMCIVQRESPFLQDIRETVFPQSHGEDVRKFAHMAAAEFTTRFSNYCMVEFTWHCGMGRTSRRMITGHKTSRKEIGVREPGKHVASV